LADEEFVGDRVVVCDPVETKVGQIFLSIFKCDYTQGEYFKALIYSLFSSDMSLEGEPGRTTFLSQQKWLLEATKSPLILQSWSAYCIEDFMSTCKTFVFFGCQRALALGTMVIDPTPPPATLLRHHLHNKVCLKNKNTVPNPKRITNIEYRHALHQALFFPTPNLGHVCKQAVTRRHIDVPTAA
jgi:hypothetical protein